MTVANSNETSRSEYVKVEVFTNRKEMEEFITRLEAESGIEYVVSIYPADTTDVKIPVHQHWSDGESYTVVAQGTTI